MLHTLFVEASMVYTLVVEPSLTYTLVVESSLVNTLVVEASFVYTCAVNVLLSIPLSKSLPWFCSLLEESTLVYMRGSASYFFTLLLKSLSRLIFLW